jgi:multidrug efflux pump
VLAADQPHERVPHGFNGWVDARLKALVGGLPARAGSSVGSRLLFGVLMLAALAASVGLFTLVPRELAPTEDRGAFFVPPTVPRARATTTRSSSWPRSSRRC